MLHTMNSIRHQTPKKHESASDLLQDKSLTIHVEVSWVARTESPIPIKGLSSSYPFNAGLRPSEAAAAQSGISR